jgi:hypothetical protein
MLPGPDYRLVVRRDGTGRALLSRFPVLAITAAEWAVAASFPRQFNSLPAGQFDLDYVSPGNYGSNVYDAAGVGPAAIVIAPGYVDWRYGRNGYLVRIHYVNGWPHSSLSQNYSTAGITSLAIDDCSGFAVNGPTTFQIFDGERTETAQATSASVTSGPGNLTLSAGTLWPHNIGVLTTSLPYTVQQAAIYFSVAFALVRGATAVVAPGLTGSIEHTAGGDPHEYQVLGEVLLANFMRII